MAYRRAVDDQFLSVKMGTWERPLKFLILSRPKHCRNLEYVTISTSNTGYGVSLEIKIEIKI
jgi:hypothetical protein